MLPNPKIASRLETVGITIRDHNLTIMKNIYKTGLLLKPKLDPHCNREKDFKKIS